MRELRLPVTAEPCMVKEKPAADEMLAAQNQALKK